MKSYLNQLGNEFLFVENIFKTSIWNISPGFFVLIELLKIIFMTSFNIFTMISLIGLTFIYVLTIKQFKASYDREHYINPLLGESPISQNLFAIYCVTIFASLINLIAIGIVVSFKNQEIPALDLLLTVMSIISCIMIFSNTQGPNIKSKETHYAFSSR